MATADVLASAPKLAPFNPSSADVINRTCKLVGSLGAHDVVFDLGCGDGRLLMALAERFGCRCVGVEYDERYVLRAREEVAHKGLSHLISVRHADVCKVTDLDTATVVFLYLSVQGNEELVRLVTSAYEGGARIVSNMFSLKYLGEAAEVVECDGITRLYLYDKADAAPASVPASAAASERRGAAKEAKGQKEVQRRGAEVGEAGEQEEEENENENEMLKWLQWLLDPLRNPAIMIVFNVAMVSLATVLATMAYYDVGSISIHVYNMGILTICLFVSLNWFLQKVRAAIERERLEKEAEEQDGEGANDASDEPEPKKEL